MTRNILQCLGYEYDDFGNLAARIDKKRALMETFGYDELDRLDSIWLNNAHTGLMTYDALGRMTGKMADGQQVFGNAQYGYTGPNGQLRPHAVSSVETGYNPFPTDQLDIDYTMFDKVRRIISDESHLLFDYGYDHQRVRMRGTPDSEKVYVGNCEFVSDTNGTTALTYLIGPLGVFAVVEQREGFRPDVYYVFKDHLGSWTTITDAGGYVEREQSFDAWGNMRDPDTWTGTVTQQPMFDRGYTGHEHLNAFGLINMNGRMYDPVMSSFLSVDKYVSQPDNSQNFNRYTYCLNNPLKYIDPSGWKPIGGLKPKNPFHDNWSASYSRHAYEPRDFGILQISDVNPDIAWMEANDMRGGVRVGQPIIDPSEMTPSQIETFQNSMEFASENSSLFRALYEILDNSSVVYKILIGKTDNNAPAQYNSKDNTIVFREESGLSQFMIYSEELFHAFQKSENKELYNSSEFNYEYEAKVAKFFMYAQIYYSPFNVTLNNSFDYTVSYFAPEDVVGFPTAQTITGNHFLDGYFEGAKRYAEWNNAYNYGDLNYRKSTMQNPYSLIRLFKY